MFSLNGQKNLFYNLNIIPFTVVSKAAEMYNQHQLNWAFLFRFSIYTYNYICMIITVVVVYKFTCFEHTQKYLFETSNFIL